jgi:hypothetical protein
MARSGGLGKSNPQISPLRCAPVEMTKGRAVMVRGSGSEKGQPQISPLRYAPVEMTKGRAVMVRGSGSEKGQPRISSLRCAPVEMTKGRAVMVRGSGSGKGNRRSQIAGRRQARVFISYAFIHESTEAFSVTGCCLSWFHVYGGYRAAAP